MTSLDDRRSAAGRDEFDSTLKGRKARWERLTDPEKEAIRARFDGDNPMPPRMHVGLWELIRRLASLDLMESEGPVLLIAAAPEPDPIPDPPGDPQSGLSDEERRDFLDGLAAERRCRLAGCSPARLDEIVLESRIGVLGGERFGRNPAPIPEPGPVGVYS